MPLRPTGRRVFLAPALCVVLAAAITACSSSSSSSSSSSAPATSPAASSSPATGGSAAAATAIKTNWETFFNGKTPAATRIALVQDGDKFASVIKSMSGSALAQTASASVQSVTVTSPAQADVTYTILVSGTPVLKNQKGVAVYENGTWKVGLSSFCSLLTLENNGKVPAGCSSAS